MPFPRIDWSSIDASVPSSRASMDPLYAGPSAGPSGGISGGGGGMDPFTMMLLLTAGSKAFDAIGGSISGRKQREQQQQQTEMSMGLEESTLDPFRAVNAQRSQLMKADRAMNTSPRERVMGPNGFERLSGGQYTMSPEVMQFLAELRTRIASGSAQNPALTPKYSSGVQDLTIPGGRYAPRPATAPMPGQKYKVVNGKPVPY